MTANQRKRKCLVQEAKRLFLIADNLKSQSSALLRRTDELRKAMRLSQTRVHKRHGFSADGLEVAAMPTGA